MRTIYLLALIVLTAGCVSKETAVAYASRAHPECRRVNAINHRLSGESQTEVSMECPPAEGCPQGAKCNWQRRSITVKCVFGFGIFADTTCHENN